MFRLAIHPPASALVIFHLRSVGQTDAADCIQDRGDLLASGNVAAANFAVGTRSRPPRCQRKRAIAARLRRGAPAYRKRSGAFPTSHPLEGFGVVLSLWSIRLVSSA